MKQDDWGLLALIMGLALFVLAWWYTIPAIVGMLVVLTVYTALAVKNRWHMT